MPHTATIAALATAPAPAGVGIIRLSGDRAAELLRAVFRAKENPEAQPRKLVLGTVIDPAAGCVLDQVFAVYFKAPHSFTGEDVVELQFHGSPLLARNILRALYAAGAVPAEPGEFSKRAFINGKLDLAQVEALSDVITATSDQALARAQEQLAGRFSGAVREIGEPLRDVLAELEAGIDFPEEDIEPAAQEKLAAALRTAQEKISGLRRSYSWGHVLRDGFKVLLCGPPNAGKSSLLNAFVGKPRAIVTSIAGTTRDLIEEEVLLDGQRFVFCDSAGLREGADTVEQIGIELALERVGWADVVLFVVGAGESPSSWKESFAALSARATKIWLVCNKTDAHSVPRDLPAPFPVFALSVKTRAGFSELTRALSDELNSRKISGGEANVVVTNERHLLCLNRAGDSLERCLSGIAQKAPAEIICAELKIALDSLAEIVGATYTEDILGRIFSKFCIGK